MNGIIRTIDKLGRVVIPKELRRALRCDAGDAVAIGAFGQYILLCPQDVTPAGAAAVPPDSPLLRETSALLSTLAARDLVLAAQLLRRLSEG